VSGAAEFARLNSPEIPDVRDRRLYLERRRLEYSPLPLHVATGDDPEAARRRFKRGRAKKWKAW